MQARKFVIAFGMVFLSTHALARTPECTHLDKAHWISEARMQKVLIERGYRIINLKLVGSCYKVHLETKEGKQLDAIYNPVGGYPLQRKVK